MSSNLKSDVREYILNRRTISFGNVCEKFEKAPEALIPIVKDMELKEEIRINNSACTLDCSSCSSCEDEVDDRIKITSIFVSIKRLF